MPVMSFDLMDRDARVLAAAMASVGRKHPHMSKNQQMMRVVDAYMLEKCRAKTREYYVVDAGEDEDIRQLLITIGSERLAIILEKVALTLGQY